MSSQALKAQTRSSNKSRPGTSPCSERTSLQGWAPIPASWDLGPWPQVPVGVRCAPPRDTARNEELINHSLGSVWDRGEVISQIT